jgi:hypothetical protein
MTDNGECHNLRMARPTILARQLSKTRSISEMGLSRIAIPL